MKLWNVLLAGAAIEVANAASAAEWRERSIYQVITDRYSRGDGSTSHACDTAIGKYCGGTWKGIINDLDYIKNMGFSAIWISPVTSQIKKYTKDLAAYHGFWPDNINKLNDNFGSEADLLALSKAVHDRGMYLMVDVVTNHMAYPGSHSKVKYSDMHPFDNKRYYHDYCSTSASATSSQTECWLGDDNVSLVDLRTEDDDVRTVLQTWVKDLVTKYSIDGLRLDSAGNVDAAFFPGFCDAAGVFCMGEVYSGNTLYTCPYQKVMDSVLNYPVYFPLVRAFNSTTDSMTDLVQQVYNVQTNCSDPTLVGSFSENHDQPRFASYTSDQALDKNIIAFTMLSDGIPIIYQGQEQHYAGGSNPYNREALWLSEYSQNSTLYSFVTSLNVLRSKAINDSSLYTTYINDIFYNDTSTLAMRRGHTGAQVVTVLNNDGSYGHKRTMTLAANATGFTANEVLVDVVSCNKVTADSNGDVGVIINVGAPLVLYPAANLHGSVVCTVSGDGTSTDVASPETRYHIASAAVRDFVHAPLVTVVVPLMVGLLAGFF